MIAHRKILVVATAFDNECLLLVNNLTEQKIVKTMKFSPRMFYHIRYGQILYYELVEYFQYYFLGNFYCATVTLKISDQLCFISFTNLFISAIGPSAYRNIGISEHRLLEHWHIDAHLILSSIP